MKDIPAPQVKKMRKAINVPTGYTVQFELPVDNPVNNVRTTCGRQARTFFVPINYPDIHNLTYPQLVAAAERSGLLHLSTPLNTDSTLVQRSIIKPGGGK